jgi:hypothetical protein
MKNFDEWRKNKNLEGKTFRLVTKPEFLDICMEYFGSTLRGNMKSVHQYKNANLIEAAETSRYSVEVNYRTNANEALEGFAKICLGYISAAMKKAGYHTKHIYTESPIRLLVSSRNWDDGENVGCVTWHPEHKCFVLSKGTYNRDRNTISIKSSDKCSGNSASEISKELINTMHSLKKEPDQHREKLKPVPLKRGPKR